MGKVSGRVQRMLSERLVVNNGTPIRLLAMRWKSYLATDFDDDKTITITLLYNEPHVTVE